LKALELFAGAGGLGMGVSQAGFRHAGVIEWNRDACDTLRENQRRGTKPVAEWPEVYQGDARTFDFTSLGTVDLVAGGPPCQPFSLGGKHGAYNDSRDMWPEAVRAVRELRPRAFMFENVKGLTRSAFAEYFQHIILQLSFPEAIRRADEPWHEHRIRLLSHSKGVNAGDLRYRVEFKVLNACDYGVPQRRHRVFVVGFREDEDVKWTFPKPTHSHDALLWAQYVTGEYWERHQIPKRTRPSLPPSRRAAVERLRGFFPPTTRPWTTVRDALVGLPEPTAAEDSVGLLNHRLQPGARSYAGHTGSPLDEPAKALKAGVHGVPGGENMLLRPDGTVRYFTVRESARLQAFPDDYAFQGAWGEIMRQLGNAVPVGLGRVVAEAVHACLDGPNGSSTEAKQTDSKRLTLVGLSQ
jgi:DNA (cytosine-5)-methyltransferase 1